MPRRLRKLSTQLEQYSSQLRMARASELAALGHYDLAIEALNGKEQKQLEHEELDILARIHIRKGDYHEAAQCWQEAITLEPSSESGEYRDCLKSMDQWLRHREDLLVWKLRLMMWLCALAAAAWLTLRLMTFKG